VTDKPLPPVAAAAATVAGAAPAPTGPKMRNRLRDGVRMLYFVDCCGASIRTIPRLQHDPLKGEDIDTQSVDHVADETRYACMARPWLKIPNLEERINGPAD